MTARTEASAPRRASPSVHAAQPARLPVRVRPAQPTDHLALVDLRRQAEEVHARMLPDYFRVSAEADGAVPGSASGAMTLVAETSGGPARVVGYVAVRVVETPRDPAMTPRRRAHIEVISVDGAHRGGGIGMALMRAALAWARRRGAAELVLTVWSDNPAADALYRRMGFEPIARVLRLPVAADET